MTRRDVHVAVLLVAVFAFSVLMLDGFTALDWSYPTGWLGLGALGVAIAMLV